MMTSWNKDVALDFSVDPNRTIVMTSQVLNRGSASWRKEENLTGQAMFALSLVNCFELCTHVHLARFSVTDCCSDTDARALVTFQVISFPGLTMAPTLAPAARHRDIMGTLSRCRNCC